MDISRWSYFMTTVISLNDANMCYSVHDHTCIVTLSPVARLNTPKEIIPSLSILMQRNPDAFLNAESGGTIWCSWSAAICNQTAKSVISSRLNEFLATNATTGDHSWNVAQTKASSLVSLNSSSSSVYLFNEDSSRVHIYKPRSKVTFGRLESIYNQLYAFVGEENGSVYVFHIDNQSVVSLYVKCESKFSTPIQFIVPHPTQSASSSFQMWVLSDLHISLVGGSTSSTISTSVNMERLLTYRLEQNQANSVLRVQVSILLSLTFHILTSHTTIFSFSATRYGGLRTGINFVRAAPCRHRSSASVSGGRRCCAASRLTGTLN